MVRKPEITTIDELRGAIEVARAVLVAPRFGTNESWVKISKKEARWYLRGYQPEDTAESLDMDMLAFWDEENLGFLYLG